MCCPHLKITHAEKRKFFKNFLNFWTGLVANARSVCAKQTRHIQSNWQDELFQENLARGGAAGVTGHFPAQVVDRGHGASVSRLQGAPPAERRRHSRNENGAVRSWSHRPRLAQYQGRLRPAGSDRYAHGPPKTPGPVGGRSSAGRRARGRRPDGSKMGLSRGTSPSAGAKLRTPGPNRAAGRMTRVGTRGRRVRRPWGAVAADLAACQGCDTHVNHAPSVATFCLFFARLIFNVKMVL